MRERRNAIPRVESLEDRVIPSLLGINMPSWVTTDFHKMGNAVDRYAKSAKSYLRSLNHGRSGQSVQAQGQTRHAPVHHTNDTLLGLPWLKL